MTKIPSVSRYKVLKNRKEILKNPLPFHRSYFEKFGHTFKIDLGPGSKWVFTRNPETIKYILQTNQRNYHKSDLQSKDLAKYIGHGILTSNGESWRIHRRMIQPAFHKKKLEGLLRIMYQSIQQELQGIKSNTEQNVFPLMGDLAFQVVAQSLFSADDIRERMGRLKEITIRIQEMLVREFRLPYLKWWFRLTGEIDGHLDMSREARKILNEIVQERVDSRVENDDLFDMLLNARYEDGTPMSRKQLIEEILVLFTAGHETTANALGFTLSLIAKHSEIQKKLFKEVNEVDLESEDILEQLSRLTFTKQCVEESLRLYPPLYILDRVSLKADIINGHQFDKNTVWLMSFYELHRHPDFWKNPDDFCPDRFDSKNKKDFSDWYFPFGAGPRMCIGNNFAMYEMIMVVAILVKKFHLTTSTKDIEINPLLTLKPKEVVIKFASRKKGETK